MSDTATAPRLAIVIPCYNEEGVLEHTVPRLLGIVDGMRRDGLIADGIVMCADDGSTDATWQHIARLHEADARVHGVRLAHNRGQQFALLAGLEAALPDADILVTLDADLQDPPEAIVDMVRSYRKGAEIVFGVRNDRSTDSPFKRASAHAYYRLQRSLGLDTVFDHANYRLMSARAVQMLLAYPERNIVLRGIVPQLGLHTDTVYYRRAERVTGVTKYNMGRMLTLAVDGITSFTARPMRLILITGIILLLLDLAVAIYVGVSWLSRPVLSGWTSLMLSVWFLGSLVLMALGIIGEYVGKIYTEVKQRPRYVISDRI